MKQLCSLFLIFLLLDSSFSQTTDEPQATTSAFAEELSTLTLALTSVTNATELNIEKTIGLNIEETTELNIEETTELNIEETTELNIEETTELNIEETTEHIAVQKWRILDKATKKLSSDIYKKILPVILRANEGLNISSQCSRGLMKFLIGMKQMKLWAFSMFDSSGKIPNGLLSGNINSLGDYDQCLDVTVPGNFRGQYCTVDISPPLPERRAFVSTDSEVPEFINFSYPDMAMSEFVKRANHYYSLNYRTSVCVPSTCSSEEVQALLNKVVQMTGIEFEILIPNCEVLREGIELDKSQLTIIIIIGFILLLSITSTVTDVTFRLKNGENYQDQLSVPLKYLLCFSFYTNTVRLLKPDTNPDSIKIFHGMKVITILWVILNHSYYYLNYQACTSLLNAREVGKEIAFQFIANGFLNVETFFFISAVLVAYGVMKMKELKLNIGLYIFRRIWRLTPPFMFVIALVFLVPLIGSGPVWKETVIDQLTDKCRANWWTNLIFINNFIGSADMCMQWLWYIPVDTHLYFLSLLVLIPLKKNPRFAFVMNALILLVGTTISAVFHVYYGLTPTAIYAFNHPEDINYYIERGYFRSYLHCSTYCVGMAVGYIIATKPKLRISVTTNVLGWISSVVMALSVLYGVYEWNQGSPPGMAVSTLYACTKTFIWSLALAWVTIVCMTGNGGIATSILSWSVFVPLGRLTYMTYLIHPVIHMAYTGSTRTLIRTDHRTILYLYLGNVLLSFICAYGLSLLFESPFMALEKVMFAPRRSSKKPTSAKQQSNGEIAERVESLNNFKKSSLVENNGIYAIKIKQVEANG